MATVKQTWQRTNSGILLPVGIESESSNRSRSNYLDTKLRSEEIRNIFRDSNIKIHPNSGLAKLIRSAEKLWEKWLLNDKEGMSMDMLFKTLHIDRVANAVKHLKGEKECPRYLKAMSSGTLDFFERKHSRAKSFLWELEVWEKLKRNVNTVFLQDPPDVVVDWGDSRIGIACKKIFSERSVSKALSEAVSQIEDDFDAGIAAVNIDDLVPEEVVLKSTDFKSMSDRLHNINLEFLNRHERHFRKYLSSGRLVSATISTSLIADIRDDSPQFNNANQWTIWTIPGLESAKNAQLNRFYNVVMK